MLLRDKLTEAKEILKRCKSPMGYYASTDTYFGQIWLRDSVISMPGLEDKIALVRQLLLLRNLQRPSGEIPTVIYTPRCLQKIIPNCLRLINKDVFLLKPIINDLKFLLMRQREKDSQDLRYVFVKKVNSMVGYHAWTGDNELFFIIGVQELAKEKLISPNDYRESLKRALRLIELKKNCLGLLSGTGWMDAMRNYRGNPTLNLNVLLYRMYKLLGRFSEAENLKETLNSPLFYSESRGYYKAKPLDLTFDTLSHAWMLKMGLIPENRIERVIAKLESIRTKFGYPNLDPPYSYEGCGQLPYHYQNGTCWPMIDIEVVLTLKKLGFKASLPEQKDFNEWYNPFTGEPRGSKNQLWSAAGYLQVKDLFL